MTPKNPDFANRVETSFAAQNVMHTFGASLVSVEAGRVVLQMDFNPDLTQQHGFLHAGVITTMLDSAAGYAAFSLMDAKAEVLTIELKTNLMSPARGVCFRFEGNVVKAGKTITFCASEAFAIDENGLEKKVASMTATMMATTV